MLKTPLNTVYDNEVSVGDKRRGHQSHMARAVKTPWRERPFTSGAEAADYAMLHGGSWILLIAARAGSATWRNETNEQIIARIRKNAQQNILGRARRASEGFYFV